MADSTIRAVVGLGNPGAEYEHTRHNAGFWFVDLLAEAGRAPYRVESKFQGVLAKVRLGGADLLLLKPATFMNRSGQAIQALAAFYKFKPEEILVAHDELDLPPGTARLKRGGGHGGHNGLRSVHQHLGEQYARLRIGIGHPGDKDQVLDYVLGRPSQADLRLIEDALSRAQAALDTLLKQSWDKAAQQLHTDPNAPKPARKPPPEAQP
ncbi:MAG TPA: aminoacyl-tRNA hydrolase [Nevskia sp.]|nr:aminoacyl-tRNA hydrolase [Nevskia sp.]